MRLSAFNGVWNFGGGLDSLKKADAGLYRAVLCVGVFLVTAADADAGQGSSRAPQVCRWSFQKRQQGGWRRESQQTMIDPNSKIKVRMENPGKPEDDLVEKE